ncbi:hypothetical protein R0K20_21745, partial [Staphylococcus sp. SIMBA_130]
MNHGHYVYIAIPRRKGSSTSRSGLNLPYSVRRFLNINKIGVIEVGPFNGVLQAQVCVPAAFNHMPIKLYKQGHKNIRTHIK